MALGGDAVSCFGGGDAPAAVVAVSVHDVAGERVGEGVPVEVVGVGDDELAERGEVTLDRVQVALA
jgi:hypothetical protein